MTVTQRSMQREHVSDVADNFYMAQLDVCADTQPAKSAPRVEGH
jgi:hypothetical protein